MLKSKDFYLKGVYNERGKKLGIVDDLYIDFHSGKVKGFNISNYSFFSKKNFVSIEDIIVFDDEVIVKEVTSYEGVKLCEIKGMDVIDLKNNMKGVVEDILISKEDFSIKGLIMSAGIIERIIRGKDILLLNECILGEDYILYFGNEGISFKTIPHNAFSYGIDKEV
ncbi:MAG: PRC-barrel domain-containing protein [Clostridium sp.]